MKTGKKIAVGLAAALVVAIFAGGAVSMVGAQFSVSFTADIKGFDVSIVEGLTDFGNVAPEGGPAVIPVSFTLSNAGDLPAEVYASSTGLSDEQKVIQPECLSIKGVQLSESDTNIATVDAESSVDFDAALSVPGDQERGSYSGTVELTFSLT
ncbi:hypothetical protein C4E24_02045 [ANME-1 cluster archaeon AG-394-G21]|nr:hypothetical protein [ANME-1 cluster archaeon AG-394-G21]